MVDHSVSATKILQSVVVTGSGNSVSLTFGTSGLVLPLDRKQIRSPERRRTQAAGERQRELDILDPSRSRLPLIGREAVLADLRGWLVDEPDISVHALTGKAGTGKTRLAIELCAAIDGGQEPGEAWAAGFLSPVELEGVAEVYATTAFDWEKSTLLVIDYAGQGRAALGRWLDRLATRKLKVKLRILLLEREAPQGFGWWHGVDRFGAQLGGGPAGAVPGGLPATAGAFRAQRSRRSAARRRGRTETGTGASRRGG